MSSSKSNIRDLRDAVSEVSYRSGAIQGGGSISGVVSPARRALERGRRHYRFAAGPAGEQQNYCGRAAKQKVIAYHTGWLAAVPIAVLDSAAHLSHDRRISLHFARGVVDYQGLGGARVGCCDHKKHPHRLCQDGEICAAPASAGQSGRC